VLAGGIVAAVAGPELAASAKRLEPLGLKADFSGCFALVAAANVANLALIASVTFAEVARYAPVEDDDPERLNGAAPARKTSLRAIFSQPECVCAVWVATLAHTAMVMLMSPLTLAMEADDYSFRSTSTTLELHFVAMYAPGLLGTGALIRKIGPHGASALGFGVFAAAAATLAAGQSYLEYSLGMVLCGAAWNLCFTSGTVLLRAGKGCDIPNFRGASLGRFPLVSANLWTSDHLSERSRSMDAFETRARGTLTFQRRCITLFLPRSC
jgi:hypothetical protein